MTVTPDGIRYAAASEQRVARPFHYRWLMPKLLGREYDKWHRASRVSSYALLPLTFLYVGGWRGVAAACMALGLSGVWKFNRAHPVLVDLHGMVCALASADAFRHHYWPLGLALALLGGCVRETSPVFAALYAWNPVALIGLVPVAVRHLQSEGPDVLDAENKWILEHPFLASKKYHANTSLMALVLPWGAALVAVAHPSPQLLLTVAFAYVQCAVATDTIRLYQWCWPVMLAGAAAAVPLAWLPLLVLLTIANPFAGDGA